jgi:CheY-like chemotaxis protein
MADFPLILVVDDSPIQRKIYATALKAGGFRVLVAENGLQGVEMALQYNPVLILMDVSMPEMDGPTAVQELRRHPAMVQVPIVAVTAITEPDGLENLYQAGFDDVVDKNSDRAVLLEQVHQWISG